MIAVDRPLQALRALADGSATVAVLPLPNDDDSWWVSLMSEHELQLRVFARLPFVSRNGEEVRALDAASKRQTNMARKDQRAA